MRLRDAAAEVCLKRRMTMNQIFSPRSFFLCCVTVVLSFVVPQADAFGYADQNHDLTSSCSVPPSATFADLTIRVTDPTGAVVDRAEIEARCGLTVVGTITSSDGTATLHLRSGTTLLLPALRASQKRSLKFIFLSTLPCR
jgi:hypothetical protein